MVSYLHEDDLRAAQRASDDEMALIEAHRAWDARRKVLEEAAMAAEDYGDDTDWLTGREIAKAIRAPGHHPRPNAF